MDANADVGGSTIALRELCLGELKMTDYWLHLITSKYVIDYSWLRLPQACVVAILVMWPTSFEQILSPDHKGSTWNLTLTYPAAWKQMLESINLNDLWQRSNNDLDLWYSNVFVYSLRQLSVLTFSSKVSIVPMKLVLKYFPIQKL